ncbi:hypothetical protein ENBRE01_1848 [Enteropsectra breve]|nr:hypothetical protein ENBRE01_1848 [Enteropsectra breve]
MNTNEDQKQGNTSSIQEKIVETSDLSLMNNQEKRNSGFWDDLKERIDLVFLAKVGICFICTVMCSISIMMMFSNAEIPVSECGTIVECASIVLCREFICILVFTAIFVYVVANLS